MVCTIHAADLQQESRFKPSDQGTSYPARSHSISPVPLHHSAALVDLLSDFASGLTSVLVDSLLASPFDSVEEPLDFESDAADFL